MFWAMENVKSSVTNCNGNNSKTQQKKMRKTKYSREPLLSKMMDAIRKVRECSRSIKEVAEETGFPCRTLRRYVELSMDDSVTSPFYFPLACDEAPIGRKFRQKFKNRAMQRKATNDINAATSALPSVEPLSEITASIEKNSRQSSPRWAYCSHAERTKLCKHLACMLEFDVLDMPMIISCYDQDIARVFPRNIRDLPRG